jgi:hypothetical protein
MTMAFYTRYPALRPSFLPWYFACSKVAEYLLESGDLANFRMWTALIPPPSAMKACDESRIFGTDISLIFAQYSSGQVTPAAGWTGWSSFPLQMERRANSISIIGGHPAI